MGWSRRGQGERDRRAFGEESGSAVHSTDAQRTLLDSIPLDPDDQLKLKLEQKARVRRLLARHIDIDAFALDPKNPNTHIMDHGGGGGAATTPWRYGSSPSSV